VNVSRMNDGRVEGVECYEDVEKNTSAGVIGADQTRGPEGLPPILQALSLKDERATYQEGFPLTRAAHHRPSVRWT